VPASLVINVEQEFEMKSLVLAMVAASRSQVTCPAGAAVKTIVIVHGAFSDASG